MNPFFKSSADKQLIQKIKNIFGFCPGNVFLYNLALRHRSMGKVKNGIKTDNERLEFLGDAILDAVVADYLFKTFPTRDEGFLTETRSKIVNRSQLNKLSKKLGLDQLIKKDKESNGTFRSFAGDALEAIIGAIFLDKGYAFTRRVLVNRIILNHFNLDELISQNLNFKSKLIEWAQREKKTIQFQIVDELGNGFKKEYIVEVLVDNVPIARSHHYSIKGAEQLVAEKAAAVLPVE